MGKNAKSRRRAAREDDNEMDEDELMALMAEEEGAGAAEETPNDGEEKIEPVQKQPQQKQQQAQPKKTAGKKGRRGRQDAEMDEEELASLMAGGANLSGSDDAEEDAVQNNTGKQSNSAAIAETEELASAEPGEDGEDAEDGDGEQMPAGLNAAQKKRWRQRHKAKEKKEASKQTKPDTAASVQAAASSSDEGSTETALEAEDALTAAEIMAEEMPKGLTPAQKKRWKAKQKQRLTKAQAREKGAASSANGKAPDAAPKAANKGKKGISSGLAELLRQRQEEDERVRREEEERKAKLEAERERRRLEAEEAERIAAEKRAVKKEGSKDRIAQKKAAAAEAKRQAALARLQASGLVVPGGGVAAKPKKPVYTNKRKQNKGQSADSDSLTKEPEQSARIVETTSQGAQETACKLPEKQPTETEAADTADAEDAWADGLESEEDWANLDADALLSGDEDGEDDKDRAGQPEKEAPATAKQESSSDSEESDVDDEMSLVDEHGERKMRSPICVIMGHVDTGKTKLLDKIRRTNVQEGEAGGITQQIGATYFPMENIGKQLDRLPEKVRTKLDLKMPGLLIIDTPGHESFANLRSRGSGLCDIAILVVDIMHGMEPQTRESLELLKMRKTPFIVALNKVDRLFDWKAQEGAAIQDSLKQQPSHVQGEFDRRSKEAIALFAAEGLNAALYYKNPDFRKFISVVPTSAHTGEGIPDLLMLLCQLTQKMQAERLYLKPQLDCTVLEVKQVDGLGTTIDVILVNGILHVNDEIVLCGFEGPIRTRIRALLTPDVMKELRVKSKYKQHKFIPAAMGLKISAPGMENAIAGSNLFVVGPRDDVEEIEKRAMADLDKILQRVAKTDRGVYVVASTLGSLEALLAFLKQTKIPVSGISIGTVTKKDVVKASAMVEHAREYAVILAFDVKVNTDAENESDKLGVQIMTADIIYHLFDQFTAYMDNVKKAKREEAAGYAVFPCRVRILPEHIINKHKPIIVGVLVEEGTLRLRTPLAVPSQGGIVLGRVFSIEANNVTKQEAKAGQMVAIRIDQEEGHQDYTYGRHFGPDDELVSKITRKSIDKLKEQFRDDITKEDIKLLQKLKVLFRIQ